MGRNKLFSASVGGILLISLAIANGQDCSQAPWGQGEPKCPNTGQSLIYWFTDNEGDSSGWCCVPDSKGAKTRHSIATGCQVTKCIPPTQANPCATGMEYQHWYKGAKVEYDEVNRESCTLEDGSKGAAVYCCQKGSLESALASTMGAEPHEFPHMALLSVGGQCGGTIYNSRWILTAAHCIVDKESKKLQTPDDTWVAKVGRNVGGVEMKDNDYKIIEAIPHPEYSKREGHPNLDAKYPMTFNDIAFLKVDRDIKFGPNVKALEIAPQGFDELKYADSVVIVGWGTTDTLELSDNLQKANFIIRSDDTCFKYEDETPWPYQFNRTKQLLCVGGIREGKWSPTAGGGDSGGPAVCRGADGYAVLCGVTSYGGSDEKCAANNNEEFCPPSVYAEVDHFRDFIKEIAGDQERSTFYKVQVYGEVVNGPKYAHQVHITSDTGKACGGTLIAPDTVVTAGQCVSSGDGSDTLHRGIKVWSGVQDISKGKGEPLEIKNVAVAPDFKRTGGEINVEAQGNRVLLTDQYHKNDLAVIKLKAPVNVNPGNLPRLPEEGEVVTNPGLEYAFPRNISRGGELRQREFNILDKDDCQRRMDRLEKVKLNVKVDSSLLCGVEKYSGGSQCDRELGGGLICKGKNGKDTLCGIQVFRLCEWSIPNGFLDVAQYSRWVGAAKEQL